MNKTCFQKLQNHIFYTFSCIKCCFLQIFLKLNLIYCTLKVMYDIVLRMKSHNLKRTLEHVVWFVIIGCSE